MKLVSIYFIFSLFISPIFGDFSFNLDLNYEQPTFIIRLNSKNVRVLFTTEQINPQYSIAITPIDNCLKPNEQDYCYKYIVSPYKTSNETINVNLNQFEGFLSQGNFYLSNYYNLRDYYIYAGNFYGGVVSFDKNLLSKLYSNRKSIDINYQNYSYYNYTYENVKITIGYKKYFSNYSTNEYYQYTNSKSIQVNEIDFAISSNDFSRNSFSIKEHKLDNPILIEFYHYLDYDSVYGPADIINKLVNLLKQNNFTCNEINNSIICDSSIYYGFFKIKSYGIQFNHLKFKKLDKLNHLFFGLKTIDSLSMYYDYDDNILALYSNSPYGKGIIRQSEGKDYSQILSKLALIGFGFLFGGLIIP